MTFTFGLAIYFVIWWITLFAVLPFGLRTQDEEKEIVPGTPESAPHKPRLLRTFLLNSLVAGVVFAVLWAAYEAKLLDFSHQPIPGIE